MLLVFLLYKDSILISRSFLLSFRERRKSNVGGRTERLKGGVNGSISEVGRQQNTKWNLGGKVLARFKIPRISRKENSNRFFEKTSIIFFYHSNNFFENLFFIIQNNFIKEIFNKNFKIVIASININIDNIINVYKLNTYGTF